MTAAGARSGSIAHKGDPFEDRPLGAPYEKTPALELAPYMESIIDGFETDKKRVRLMELQPQKSIFWHYDKGETIDNGKTAEDLYSRYLRTRKSRYRSRTRMSFGRPARLGTVISRSRTGCTMRRLPVACTWSSMSRSTISSGPCSHPSSWRPRRSACGSGGRARAYRRLPGRPQSIAVVEVPAGRPNSLRSAPVGATGARTSFGIGGKPAGVALDRRPDWARQTVDR